MIVPLCVMREETNPDPISVTKYPNEINRNSDPASEWLTPMSFSIAGIKGPGMTLEIKFKKKIVAKKRRGHNCERNDDIFS